MQEVVSTTSVTFLVALHQNLIDHFSWDEIEDLCFRLGIDYEIAPGTIKSRWLRELLRVVARDGHLSELLDLAREKRPLIAWPPLPDDFQMPPWPERVVWDGRIPYLGLEAFQEGDAQFFFGREELVNDLLTRLQEARFIAIAGPSGSGKSSMARAGLFHALRQGRLERSNTWLLAAMQPKGQPLEQLARAMARLAKSPDAGDYIRKNGANNSLALHEQAESLLSDDDRQRCVLLVDQFEEIFTQTKNEDTRSAFVDLLTTAAQVEEGRTIIILCLRSDFISNCASYQQLRPLVSGQFQLVGAMSRPDLAKAITLPALEVGAEIDPALVKQIIVDMKGEPGALPLMSFALRDLFLAEMTELGQPMDLILQEYIERGGIESALERHADRVFESFTDEEKELARCIFSKLVELREDQGDTRQAASLLELRRMNIGTANINEVLEELVQARLITINEDQVEVAHEALIRHWPRLRDWVDKDRERLLFSRRLTRAAQEWVDNDHHLDYLFVGARLARAESQIAEYEDWEMSDLQESFIKASEEAEREKRNAELQEALLLTLFAAAGGATGLGIATMIIQLASFMQEDGSGMTIDFLFNESTIIFLGIALLVGSMTGFIYIPAFDRMVFALEKRHKSSTWLAGGLLGFLAFALAAFWLAASQVEPAGWGAVVLIGGSWGIVAGVGRLWLQRSKRPRRLSVPLVAVFSGIALTLFSSLFELEQYLAGDQEIDWKLLPLIGILVPLALLLADSGAQYICQRRKR